MAITKTNKQPRGHTIQKTRFRDMGTEGAPSSEAYPAYFLPVQEEDKVHDLWWVILAGQIVAFDQTSINSGTYDNAKELVPANGGAAVSVVYAANDVDVVLDIDQLNSGSDTLVTAAATATKQIAANRPCGVAPFNYYTRASEKAHWNVFPQPTVTFVTKGMFEIPLIFHTTAGAASVAAIDEQDTLDDGHLVVAGSKGWPVKWAPGTQPAAAFAAVSIEQIVGRCLKVITIGVVDALDKVHTVPGLSLPGTGTAGRQLHEDYLLSGNTTTYVTKKARILLTLS